MDRRTLLVSGLAAGAAAFAPRIAQAQSVFAPAPGGWRRFEVATRLDIARPEGATTTCWESSTGAALSGLTVITGPLLATAGLGAGAKL